MNDGRIKVRALLNFPEHHPGATLTIIAVVFAVAYAASLILIPKPDGRIIMGDAVHHYVPVRSLVFDRDLHLRNEYLRVYKFRGDEPEATWLSETTPTGHVRSYMPVGPGLVWAPAFPARLGHGFARRQPRCEATRSTVMGVRFRPPPPSAES